MKNIAFAAAFALMFAPSLHAEDKTDGKDGGKDYVILKVGDDSVKKSEVDSVWKSVFPGDNPPSFDTFDPKIKENILRGIASEHIILSEAEKAGVQNSEDVKERIRQAQNQIVIEEFLREKTQSAVSDDTLKAAYDEQVKAAGAGKEEVKARHILVKTEAEANAIEKKLKKGGDFAKLAKEKSEDKASGVSGGELGWFTADRMTPEFSKAAFALKKGEVSAPVKTDFGWHIIQAEDRRKVEVPSFEQMKPELRREIGAKAVRSFVDNIVKDAKVTELDADGHEKPLSMAPEPAVSPAAAKPAAGTPAAKE